MNKVTKHSIQSNSLCYGVIHEISQSTSCLDVSKLCKCSTNVHYVIFKSGG